MSDMFDVKMISDPNLRFNPELPHYNQMGYKVTLEDGSKTGCKVKQKDCVVVLQNSGIVAS